MAQRRLVVDITDNAELREIVADATASGRPIVLRVDDRDVAALEPLATTEIVRDSELERDFAEFASSFGAWSSIDGDRLKAQIKAARGSSRRHSRT